MKSADFGVTVVSKYLLSHPETGEAMELMNEMIVPPNQKQLDKAVLAALTTGLNYSLRDLLLIPRADEPEVDNLPEPQPKSAPKPAKAAAKQEPASGDRALALGLSMVFGLKPDAEGYEKALLEHASKKYDKKFTSTAELPDEYVKQVIEAHNIKMSEATAEDKALFGDK